MYPDLSYLFHDLFGTSPDNWLSIFKTFGLLLVSAILGGAYFLYLELKRKEREGLLRPKQFVGYEGGPATTGEILSNGIFGFILGFKGLYVATHFAEFQADAAGVILSGKGNWVAGLLLGAAFAYYRYWERQRNALPEPRKVTFTTWPHERIGDIAVIAAISGVIGAKVFAIIEDLPRFFADPIDTFFSGSGLAIYGGLIGGFIGVVLYMRKHDIAFWPTADAFGPPLMIAYGIGRIGCQLSGDGDWGEVAGPQPDWWFLPDWAWAQHYPHNVARDGVPIEGCEFIYCSELIPPVFPTPLYEIVMAFLLGALLWSLRKRIKTVGAMFFLYLIVNGIQRFVIEMIRINDQYEVLGLSLTQAQIIAVGLFLTGVIGWIYVHRKPVYVPPAR